MNAKYHHSTIGFPSIRYGWPGESLAYLDLDDPYSLGPGQASKPDTIVASQTHCYYLWAPGKNDGIDSSLHSYGYGGGQLVQTSNTGHSCDRCENSQAPIQEHHGPPRSQSIRVTFVLLGHRLTWRCKMPDAHDNLPCPAKQCLFGHLTAVRYPSSGTNRGVPCMTMDSGNMGTWAREVRAICLSAGHSTCGSIHDAASGRGPWTTGVMALASWVYIQFLSSFQAVRSTSCYLCRVC